MKPRPHQEPQRLMPARQEPQCQLENQMPTQKRERLRRKSLPPGRSRRTNREHKERKTSKLKSKRRSVTLSLKRRLSHHQELCTTRKTLMSRIFGYQELPSLPDQKSSSSMPPSSLPEAVNTDLLVEMELEKPLLSTPFAERKSTTCHKTSIFSKLSKRLLVTTRVFFSTFWSVIRRDLISSKSKLDLLMTNLLMRKSRSQTDADSPKLTRDSITSMLTMPHKKQP